MNALIYAGKDIENIIKNKFPVATFQDASDEIHTERFEVEIQEDDNDKTRDDFYVFALKEGFAMDILNFQLMIGMPEHQHKVKRWMTLAGINFEE